MTLQQYYQSHRLSTIILTLQKTIVTMEIYQAHTIGHALSNTLHVLFSLMLKRTL